jgi:hypothetical protein
VKDPGARLTRWRLKLEEYDYNIIYKPGTLNTNSDALSRIAQVNVRHPVDYKSRTYQQCIEDLQTTVITNTKVIEIQGDLFELPENMAIGHCVSKYFKMSERIALEFRRNFGQIETLKEQNKDVT